MFKLHTQKTGNSNRIMGVFFPSFLFSKLLVMWLQSFYNQEQVYNNEQRGWMKVLQKGKEGKDKARYAGFCFSGPS